MTLRRNHVRPRQIYRPKGLGRIKIPPLNQMRPDQVRAWQGIARRHGATLHLSNGLTIMPDGATDPVMPVTRLAAREWGDDKMPPAVTTPEAEADLNNERLERELIDPIVRGLR